MDQTSLVSRIRHLPKVLSPKELRIYIGLCALFVLSLIGVLVGLITTFTVAVAADGGRYTEGVVGRPHLINPLYAESNAVDRDLVKLLYAGLVRFDGETLIPDLAREWTISEDQKTYTFALRENVVWPDGTPFTASDVVYTLGTIQDEQYQSPRAAGLSGVTITQVDDLTVQFELPKVFSPFLEVLTVGILPKHIWSNITPESIQLTDFNVQPIGLGPYQFQKLTKTKFGTIHSYTMEHNEQYHLGKPHIKTLTMKFFDTPQGALEGLNKRDVDGIGFIPLSAQDDVRHSNIETRALQLPQYTAVFFNLSSDAPIKSEVIREALAISLDKEKLVGEALGEQGRIIDGPILPGYPGYHPDIEKHVTDSERAITLLENAGWTRSEGGVLRDDEGELLLLTLTTANTPELTAVAEHIQQTWQALGIVVDLRVIGTDSIQAEVISPRDFDILLFGQITGLDPDPYPFWHSSQISRTGFNLSNFKHTEADTVLEEARATNDLEEKTNKYVSFQNILVEEIPAIFLYNPNYLYPVDERVKGIESTIITNPSDRFARVYQWYIKTKRVFKKKAE